MDKITVRYIKLEDQDFIRYEDEEGGLKLWIPQGYSKQSLRSFFEIVNNTYKVNE